MTINTNEQDFFSVIKDRHSVRKYQPGIQMPEEDLQAILESAVMAPSSWNLQHWKFLVIQNQETKERLLPIAYNQEQVVDSSVVVAVLGDLEANTNAEIIYSAAVEHGFMNQEVKEGLVGQINGAYEANPQIARDEAIRNASLASMQLMLAAKAKGYDTCAMGGYDPVKFVEEFKVPERYVPVMLISIGKAAAAAHGSGRFPVEQMIVKETF
ncbi:nitroreductase family protein [Marininema halotolerans]|uniref:Nitroreductase n=1 Tax=Marininema halotolerans TaxID=1155944 RepID=A0A1I6TNM3_9BACL|nr:nitroreductase family protein [Marininema halotolerans]SFS90751.1 Nitroreductase [Marininema halotolerans]